VRRPGRAPGSARPTRSPGAAEGSRPRSLPRVDEELGEVRADERKIRGVVLNLLSNAIEFTQEGGRIEVRATRGDKTVEVSVSDTGVGIAPEDQQAVFEEFRQVGGVGSTFAFTIPVRRGE
jgi:signal transduction histidine kinase